MTPDDPCTFEEVVDALKEATGNALHEALIFWTIYERPTDFPDGYVLRPTIVHTDGRVEVLMSSAVHSHDLEELRACVRGLHRMPRMEQDEPQILETWL
jgi:hypothetical protein